jgi:hypothetical protein
MTWALISFALGVWAGVRLHQAALVTSADICERVLSPVDTDAERWRWGR